MNKCNTVIVVKHALPKLGLILNTPNALKNKRKSTVVCVCVCVCVLRQQNTAVTQSEGISGFSRSNKIE